MNKDFLKKVGIKSTKLIIGIAIIIIALALEAVVYFSMNNRVNNASPLVNAKDSVKYSYVDVSLMTDYFATYEDEYSKGYIYFVWDDKYMYLALINSKNLKKLDKVLEYSYDNKLEKPDSVRIYGETKEISSDLKRIAISSYNKMFDKEFLNSDNFSQYLGFYYMDTTSTPMGSFLGESIFIAIFGVVGASMIIKYFSDSKRSKGNLEKYSMDIDKITSEIDNDSIYFKDGKIYLTKSYIISMLNGLEIYKYSEIRWLYPYEYRYNGAVTNKSVFIVTKDGKVHTIAQFKASKKKIIKFNELYENLVNKTPDAMHGYTTENIEKNKEMK